MSKHTPGPLTVSHYAPHVDMRNEYALLDDRGDAIATLWGGDDRALAYANLFAAAPTMREYVQRKATEGDEEARQILEAIDVNS